MHQNEKNKKTKQKSIKNDNVKFFISWTNLWLSKMWHFKFIFMATKMLSDVSNFLLFHLMYTVSTILHFLLHFKFYNRHKVKIR